MKNIKMGAVFTQNGIGDGAGYPRIRGAERGRFLGRGFFADQSPQQHQKNKN